MSGNAEARQHALDKALDDHQANAALADDLFGIADALAGSPSLRRALTDLGSPVEARLNVVQALFGGKVSPAALAVLEQAIRLPWSASSALTSALERQGVRARLSEAERAGQLDQVEDELFRLGRVVDAHPELRASLADRRVTLPGRRQLLDDVFGSRVLPTTRALAHRAIEARARTFDLTLESYLNTAAELRNRGIATVEVAQPLSIEQTTRLREALIRQAGRDVTLNVVVNPAVLGGVRVLLGDEIIEGTVAGRLSDVRRKLS